MPQYWQEPAYTHGQAPRTGVLLVNLGTPAAPTAAALRPYLKQFLSDPRVVEAYEEGRTIRAAVRRRYDDPDRRRAGLERATLRLITGR